MRKSFWFLGLSALLLAGCGSLLDTGEPNFEFAALVLTPDSSLVSSAEVVPLNNGLWIEGNIVAPNDCQRVEASVRDGGGRFTLTINSRQSGSACATSVGYYHYRFIVNALDEGATMVQVVYNFNGAKPNETVFNESVNVP